ncbi:Phosphopentomutase [Fructilactobacillus florum 8D]|uniref:Phosphopentomutase n=1 Tax=Fructilactobacillus florum 8D TaxID=1221538 RepID=W9EM43_9LACO|nr:phosphopentomutase [Fructilactobacillus florum]EKK20438.1 Phosphopentomutase [Fructilactobacillus florum 2F]ETO40749.1 Phosphopentomutase [Fructilactobacillus florum 8D]
MSDKRVIVVDLAALGLRVNNLSATHNSDNDTLVTHVLNQSSDFALPALHRLGLFNLYATAIGTQVGTQVPLVATYGLTRTRSLVNRPVSGLREMFDCSLPYRVTSVFEETARTGKSVIISRMVSYLFSQEFSTLIQVCTNELGFHKLDEQLAENDQGFFYLQLPELQSFGEAGQFSAFLDSLTRVDQALERLMGNLRADDLLLVVSSRIGDSQSQDGFSTYKRLPVMIYDRQQTQGRHFSNEPFVCEVGATVLAALGLQGRVTSPRHSLQSS